MLVSQLQFYGYQLRNELINHEDFTTINPFIFKNFCNAIANFPQDIDTQKFLEYADYFYDTLDKAIFFTLVSKMGNKILTKDPYYISELCITISMKNTSPQKYEAITDFLITEPIYSLIINICQENMAYGFITIFEIILNTFDLTNLSPKENNQILKVLNRLLFKDYRILLATPNNLENIYNILYKKMLEINKHELFFIDKDFQTVNLLRNYLNSPDEKLKNSLLNELIASENENYDFKTIINRCLQIINEYNSKFFPLTLLKGSKYGK